MQNRAGQYRKAMRKRRVVGIIGLLLLAGVVVWCIELAIPKHDYFVTRTGLLLEHDSIESVRSGKLYESAHLVSSTGLQVDIRVLRPATAADERLPVVILLGGYETGKDAVDLVGSPVGMAFAAIDYPYHGEKAPDGFWQSSAAIPAVQRAFLDSPPAVSLAVSWLLQQPWVDPQGVEIAGVSLGVPFAAIAGAVDKRISRVWLMHGGAENVSWVAHNAREQIENEFLRNVVARVAMFAIYGNSFKTQNWIPEIAPRPLIVVAARDDDFVPRESQEPFIQAANAANVELIWTEGRHIGPRRPEELQQLLELVTQRITGR